MSRVVRDVDRAELYAAELAAFDGTDLEQQRPFDEIAAIIRAVVDTSGWWPGGPVDVRPGRSDARSSSTRCDAGDGAGGGAAAVVRLAEAQCTVATAAHELAHAVAGTGRGHDPIFRRAYLDVVAVMTNLDTTDRRHDLHVGQLTDAFAAFDLPVGSRTWPAPPSSAGDAFEL